MSAVRRLLAFLVAAAVVAMGLTAPPAAASTVSTPLGQILQWSNGTSFTTAGANAAITIDLGRVAFVNDCPTGFNDFVYSQADIYVVPAGSVSDGASLTDVSGTPNTNAPSGSVFVSELIGYTQPGGTIPAGTYAVVYDECQNGKFEQSTDALFDPALSVAIPADVPPLPSIAAAKAAAYQEALIWADFAKDYTIALNALEVLSIMTGDLTDALMYLGATYVGAMLPDVKLAAIQLLLNNAKHWKGISDDPPDPEFDQPTLLSPRPDLPARTDDPLLDQLLAVGEETGSEAALTEALLRSLERYQGADIAEDGDWALVHARAIRDNATLLADQMARTSGATDALLAEIDADPRDVEGRIAQLEALRSRVETTGFTAAEQAAAEAAGITEAELQAFRDDVSEQDLAGFTEAYLHDLLTDLRGSHAAATPTLTALATSMDPVIAHLEAEANVADAMPVVDADGPYAGEEGIPVAFDGTGTVSPTPVTSYDWDLDGDGEFDDGTGATPSFTYSGPVSGLVGLQVTNDAGTGVGYAPIAVVDSDTAPTITDASPALGTQTVEVGERLPFSVTAVDAEEQPVTVTWEVDGTAAANGTSFAYTPVVDDLGLRTIEAVADDGSTLGGATRRAWSVRVTRPDADDDGWASHADCDDTDPAVNPGANETVGNGIDDDCDPATPDSGSAPTAAVSAEPDPAVAGEPVTLDAGAQDADGGISAYAWDLGDGTTSTEPSPTHTYTAPGTVPVAVTVTDEQGDTAGDSLLLEVRARPEASFTVSPTRPAPGTPTTFTDTSTDADGTIRAWSWDLGDGTTSTEVSPSHTYAAPGTYPVSLTVTDDDGLTDRVELEVRVAAAATAAFTTAKERDLALGADGASVAVSSVFSTSGSYAATNLVDDSNSTAWRSAAAPAGDQEVRLDLAGSGVVDRLVLVTPNSPNAMRDFTLQLSDGGTADADFSTVLTATSTRDGNRQEFEIPPTTARHARLLVDTNHGGTTTQISTVSLLTRDREGGIVSLLEGGRTASVTAVSSEASNEPGSRLVDGNASTRWRTTTGTFPQTATVALAPGRDVAVDRVVVTGGTGGEYLRSFELQVAPAADPTAFTTVLSGEAAKVATPQEFSFPPVSAAHVRLVVHSNWGFASYTRVGELAVLDADRVNVASGVPTGNAAVVAVSSQVASAPGTAAIDISASTGWQTPSSTRTGSLTVRLRDGGSYLVDRVDVQGTNGTTSAKDVEIQVSSTTSADASFTTVASATIPADARAHPVTFAPVEARYVRLVVTANHGGSSLRVNELRVWSPERGGESVAFDDLSSDDGEVASWSWDFGDGASSAEQHPRHSYAAPGTYPVTLTITDDDGLTSTATMDYTVVPRPAAAFTWTPAEPGEAVSTSFTDTTTTDGAVVAWRWVTGVTSERTTAGVTTSFPDNGTYPVTLHVTDSELRTASQTRTVTVANRPPTVDAGPDRTVVWGQDWQVAATAGDPSNVDAATLACDWDLGDGQTRRIQPCTAATADVTHSYSQPGTYTATLTVTDKDGATASDTRRTTVTKRPSFVQVVDARTGAGGAVTASIRLFDGHSITGVPAASVTMSHGTQSSLLTTDATGRTSGAFTLEPGTETVGAGFTGNDLYLPAPAVNKPLDAARGDIVFMIDESGSMGGVQDAVRRNLFDIARTLGERIDFRIGVVGFGAAAGGGRARIHTTVSEDLETVHAALAKLTVDGGFEPGYHATVAGLDDDMGFRPGAGACGVLVGDEVPQWNSTFAPERLDDAIAAARARDAVMFGIVSTGNAQVAAGYGPGPGSLTAETGGSAFAINTFANNPTPVLDALLTQCINRIVAPDLGVTIAGDPTEVRPGQTVTYSVAVGNDSSGPAAGVQLEVDLPAGAEVDPVPVGATVTGGTLRWEPFALGAREQTSRTFAVRIAPGTPPGALRLTAHVADDGSNGADRDTTDNTAAADTTVLPDLVAPVVDAGADLVLTEGDEASVAAAFTDGDDDLGHTATVDWGAGPAAVPVDETARTVAASRRYDDDAAATIEVCVTDDDGLAGCDTVSLTVGNAAPIVGGGPDLEVLTGQEVRLEAVPFTDAGSVDTHAATVDWGAGDGPEPATVDAAGRTATGVGSYATPGTFTARLCVTDDDGATGCTTRAVTVLPANEAPVLAPVDDAELPEGSTASIPLSATDADGDDLAFSVTGLPAWATFTDTGDGTATIALAPGYADAGSVELTVEVTDGELADTATVTVTVTDVPPPVALPGTRATDEDVPVAVTLTATGGPTGFALASQPAHGELTGTAPDLLYTPTADFSGTDTFTYTASNAAGQSAPATITIEVAAVNDPPVLGPVAPVVMDEGTLHRVPLTATDVDGDPLTFSATGLPAWATLTDAGDGTATLDLAPGFADAGSLAVEVVVSDGQASDTGPAEVEVRNINRPPAAAAGGPYTVIEGSVVVVDAGGSSDPDGDELSYEWDVDGVFDDATGPRPELTFPDDAVHTVEVRVTDTGGLSHTSSALVFVGNADPVIAEVAVSSALAGPLAFDSVTVTPTYTDAGVEDTHTATVTVGDVVTVVSGHTSGAPVRVPLATAGCDLPVTVVITDDDGGADTGTASVSAGAGGWMPPLGNDGKAYAARAGQVIPVKVRFDDCTGVPLPDDLQPQIRIRRGDGASPGGVLTGPELTLGTVAAGQSLGTMRRIGNHYHYDLDLEIEPGTWTILVYPYGAAPGSPSLRHLLTVR